MNKEVFESHLNSIMAAPDYDEELGRKALALLEAMSPPSDVGPNSWQAVRHDFHTILVRADDAVSAFGLLRTMAKFGVAVRVSLDGEDPEMHRIVRRGRGYRLFEALSADRARGDSADSAKAIRRP